MNNSEWKNYVANGYCFYKAAKQLGTVTFKNGQANLLNVAQSFVPATVNYAFAAELGLKAIIIKEKGDIKHIHELDKLLAELSYTACHFILSTVAGGTCKPAEKNRRTHLLIKRKGDGKSPSPFYMRRVSTRVAELKAAKTHTVLYQINRTEYYCQVDLPLSDYPLYGKQLVASRG